MLKLWGERTKLFCVLFVFSRFFRIKIITNKKERAHFTRIWRKIWLEEGYAKPGEPIVEKYAKYDKFSRDLLLKFFGIIPVGTLRIIRSNNDVGLPIVNDFEIEKPWGEKEVIEATLLTVVPQFRGFFHLASLTLMKAIYQYGKREKIEGVVIAADVRLFSLLTRRLGLPFYQIGQEKMYEGSITYPAYLSLEEAERVVKTKKPKLYRFFTSR